MYKITQWLLNNSLWLVAAGLCLGSSGIDGAYMMRWMPNGWGWLGLVLNTVSDIAGMVLMYWYGRFQQGTSKRKAQLSKFLIGAEITAIAYSWFFSWRQLRFALPQVEPQDWRWVSWIAAGFIPLLLAFVGYAQSLLAGRFRAAKIEQPKAVAEPREEVVEAPEETVEITEVIAEPLKATIADWRVILPQLDGNRRQMTTQDVATALKDAGLACPSPRTLSNWAKLAQQAEEMAT